MEGVPAYSDFFRVGYSLLDKHTTEVSSLSLCITSDPFTFSFKVTPEVVVSCLKANIHSPPFVLRLKRNTLNRGKYFFQFNPRRQFSVISRCNTDSAQWGTQSSTTALLFALKNCNGQVSITDHPFRVETECVLGTQSAILGFSAGYDLSLNRILRLDLILRLRDFCLRSYGKTGSASQCSLFELAFHRRINAMQEVAALFQTNGNTFHYFEAGFLQRFRDQSQLRCKVNTYGAFDALYEFRYGRSFLYRLGGSISVLQPSFSSLNLSLSLAITVDST